MKFIKYFPLVAVALFMLQACYKDKGDYDYRDINEVGLKDTVGAVYGVLQFDTLQVKPVLSQTLADNESRLKFEWSAREIDPNKASQNFDISILSTEKLLNKQVTLVPGQYRMIYKVTDTVTAVSSYLFYTLNVGTNLSQGWMFLQQFANSGDLSVLSPTGRMFHHVYEGANGVPLAKNLHTVEVNITGTPREIYLLAGDSAVEVSPTSFGRIKGFNNWFFNQPSSIKPVRNLVFQPPSTYSRAGIMINNGLVHLKRYGGFPGDVLYGSELLLDDVANYSCAPYIMIGDFDPSRYLAAFYDTKGKRFVGLRGGTYDITANMVHFPDSVAGTPFDANHVNMDILYAGNTGQNYIYNAIMKASSGDCYMYRLNLATATGAMLKQKMNADGIANMTAAVNSLLLEYTYYAESNKIHMYEIGPNAASLIYSFPAGETVTSMAIDPSMSTDLSVAATTMMVATYDGTAGRVYQFRLNVNGRFVNDAYTNKYEGFGKVVFMKYKVQ